MNVSDILKRIKRNLYRRRDGERQIRHAYQSIYGKELDTERPILFSEKLFTRMVQLNRHGSPLHTRLADKFRVRDYVRDKVGPEYLVDLLWHGEEPTKIPFDTLPAKCVIKTNHGSGGNIVLEGKVDHESVIQKLQQWLEQNYYWEDREYQYYEIKPRILVEPFLDDGAEDGPLDYRFWCFQGRTAVIQVDNHAHDINPFYDTDWNKLDLTYRDVVKPCDIARPNNLTDLLRVAETLATDFDFVRVDLYNLAGKIYFGELTFTPVAGRCKLKPESWDMRLGDKWTLTRP